MSPELIIFFKEEESSNNVNDLESSNNNGASMPSVRVRTGDSLDKALRLLKKRLDKEGIMKAVKAHRFYSKPSIKKRAKAKAALKYKRRR